MKRLWMLAWAFFVVVALVATPVVASAMEVRPLSEAAVPTGLLRRGDSGNELTLGSGLKLRVINRATIQVEVDNGSNKIWTGVPSSDNTISQIVGGLLLRSQHDHHEYILANEDGFGQTGYERYTAIRNVDNDDSGASDIGKRWRSFSSEEISAVFDDAWMHIIATYERIPDALEDGCRISVHDIFNEDGHSGLGIVNATDDNPSQTAAWACGVDKIFGIPSVLASAENFNITHSASSDGKTLEIVFPNNDKDADSFFYCENGIYALEDCNNPRDGWFIEAAPETFTASKNVTVTVKNDSGDSYQMMVAGAGSPSNANPGEGGGGAGESDDSCEGNSGVLGWIMCPVAGLLDGILGFLDDKLQELLALERGYFTGNSGNNLRAAWTQVRNIAYIILIPIMLVMVIGTALGFEVFSAYTIKKALPRMVVAVIFITLSWYICVFLIEFFNVVGGGIRGLITNPFFEPGYESGLKGALKTAGIVTDGAQGFWGTIQDGSAAGVGLAGAAGALAIGYVTIGILLSTLASAALVMGLAFLVLVARQMFIVAAVFLAPLAILAWIFPGNDKLWKLWWNMFTKLLMMFPLIMLLIGMGDVFAKLIAEAYTGVGIVKVIMVTGAVILPYVAVPFTFKFAGGVFGNLAGMVNDRNKGVLDRLKKGRGESRAQKMSDAKNFSRFKGDNAFSKFGNAVGGIGRNSPRKTMTPSRFKAAQLSGQSAQAAASLKDDPVWNKWGMDDNFQLAVANEQLAEQKIKEAEVKRDAAVASGDMGAANKQQADIDARKASLAAARTMGNRKNPGVRMAALDALTKSGYQFSDGEEGYKELQQTVRDIVGGNEGMVGSTMNQMQFNMKGAGRFDQAGINAGGGYDPEAGLDKADPYTLATRAKKESITVKGQRVTALRQEALAAQAAGDMGIYHEKMEQAKVHELELQTVGQNATGANQKAAEDALAAIGSDATAGAAKTWDDDVVLDSSGAAIMTKEKQAFDNAKYDTSSPTFDAAYKAAWDAEPPGTIQRGERIVTRERKRSDGAKTRARGFRQPDPSTLDD